jgi:tetratricopeptide (TPR) repeat protein
MLRFNILLLLISLLLSGCQTLPSTDTTGPPTSPTVAKTLPRETAGTYGSSGTTQQTQSSTVIALLDTASKQSAAGDTANARRTLERALRIEPRNARLWNELAQLYYQDKQYIKAANTAAKSNSLAGTNNSLKRNNWKLIGNARRQTGDEAGAQRADEKAQTYY